MVDLPPVDGGDVFLPSGKSQPVDLSKPEPVLPPTGGASLPHPGAAPAAQVPTNGNGKEPAGVGA